MNCLRHISLHMVQLVLSLRSTLWMNFFFLSGRKISLSEYPVLPEICVQRWRKKYRCDQNFPSACNNWKQESEINKQYIAHQFLVSAIMFRFLKYEQEDDCSWPCAAIICELCTNILHLSTQLLRTNNLRTITNWK